MHSTSTHDYLAGKGSKEEMTSDTHIAAITIIMDNSMFCIHAWGVVHDDSQKCSANTHDVYISTFCTFMMCVSLVHPYHRMILIHEGDMILCHRLLY